MYFEGRVRNHNQGHEVKFLEYQCYESMAEKIGKRIVEKAVSLFGLHHAYGVHRHGHLQVGDTAVWVGVSSSHRKEAFEACQYIIDQMKVSIPIWKKEYYVDKPAQWVACFNCENHSHESQS